MSTPLAPIAFAVGLALITAGVAFIYWPGALITCGVLLAGASWLYEAGAGGPP